MTDITDMTDDKLTTIAERTEAENMIRLQESAPDHVKQALGMAAARIGGGVALSMRHDPTGGYWRKALGFGLDRPVDAALINEVLDFYRANGDEAAVLQIAPALLPAGWDDIIAGRGITAGSRWVKFIRPAGPLEASSDLRVGPVEPDRRQEAAEVMLRGFGMPDGGLAAMFAATSGRDDIRTFAAYEGDSIVAVGHLFLYGDSAELAGAATLPGHRGRGAQSALLAARAQTAVDEGVRWLVVETGKPGPDDHNHSYNNLVRAGFRPLYARQNWLWKA